MVKWRTVGNLRRSTRTHQRLIQEATKEQKKEFMILQQERETGQPWESSKENISADQEEHKVLDPQIIWETPELFGGSAAASLPALKLRCTQVGLHVPQLLQMFLQLLV